MSKRVWAGVLMGLLVAVASAQTTGEQALRDALVKKPNFLRGYSASTDTHWRWNNGALSGEVPQIRSWGAFTANSVKVKGSKVTIDGEREALVQSSATGYGLSGVKEHVRLSIDLTGADVAQVLPQLPELLFYPNLEAALAGTRHRPPPIVSSRPSPALKDCDCANPSVAVCGTDRADLGMAGMKAPSLTYAVDPQLSSEASVAKFAGSVEVMFTLDHNGQPTDLWVSKAGGKGLDAQAGTAVSQSKYKPATCHGDAIPVPLRVQVTFAAPAEEGGAAQQDALGEER